MCNLEIYALSLPHFHSEFLLTHKHEKLSALEAPLRQKMMINVAKSKQKKKTFCLQSISQQPRTVHIQFRRFHLKILI